MNNVKLSIFTGVQNTDIVDVGLYNPSLEGVFLEAFGDNLPGVLSDPDIHPTGGWLSGEIEMALADLNANASTKYKDFHAADLLAAVDYLTKLKIACDTFPFCTVKIETL